MFEVGRVTRGSQWIETRTIFQNSGRLADNRWHRDCKSGPTFWFSFRVISRQLEWTKLCCSHDVTRNCRDPNGSPGRCKVWKDLRSDHLTVNWDDRNGLNRIHDRSWTLRDKSLLEARGDRRSNYDRNGHVEPDILIQFDFRSSSSSNNRGCNPLHR